MSCEHTHNTSTTPAASDSIVPTTPAVPTALPASPALVETTFGFNFYSATVQPSTVIKAPTEGGWISGTPGDDAIHGSAVADYLIGNVGSDYVGGGDGDDYLLAGPLMLPGAEVPMDTDEHINVLEGGAGNDVVGGCEGEDYFVFGSDSGVDTVVAFDHQLDYIMIEANANGSGIQSFADVQHRAFDTPLGAVINLGMGNEIVVAGIPAADLVESDFWFFEPMETGAPLL
jgi:Ca2+-binding RTX toxin-like protein